MHFRIWQFSDTHLFSDSRAQLYGLAPAKTLSTVLDHARNTDIAASLSVVSGDLVHDESELGYQYLSEQLSSLNIPVYCLPGNHDDLAIMMRVLRTGNVQVSEALVFRQWQFIFLNSVIAGQVGGRLDPGQLTLLARNLAAHPDKYALIFLHHPPVPTGMEWLDDGQILENGDDLFSVLDQYPQVRAVCWGHAHQEHESRLNDIKLLGCPSTMVQFKPNCRQFTLDTASPAYRWFDCYDNGRVDSGIISL